MSQKIRKERITKIEFHKRGGMKNPALFRSQTRGGAWRYYVNLDRDVHKEFADAVFGSPTGRLPQSPEMQDLRPFKRSGEVPVLGLDYAETEARILAYMRDADRIIIDPVTKYFKP